MHAVFTVFDNLRFSRFAFKGRDMIAFTSHGPPLDSDNVSQVLANNAQDERYPRRQDSLGKEYKWSGVRGVHGRGDSGNTDVYMS